MTITRVAAAVAISALALGAATVAGSRAMAQAPTETPSPTAAAATAGCPDLGMMGPDSTRGPGMMMGDGSSMGPGMMGASPVPTASQPSSAPSDVPATVRVDVTLTDSFRIEPCVMTVRVGVPVTFVVTNSGAIGHEFFLGDAAAQATHDQEMLSMGGVPMHDEADGISVAPGETRELTYRFEAPGQFLAGCHVPGHYSAGMKAVINVAP